MLVHYRKAPRIEQVSLTEWRFSFIPEAGDRATVNVKSKKDYPAGQQTSQICVITHHHGEITTIKSRCETSSMYWNKTRLPKYQTDSMSMLPSICSVTDHRWGQNVVKTEKGAERRCYWCSQHILMSSVICYWIDPRAIYLLHNVKKQKVVLSDITHSSVLQ